MSIDGVHWALARPIPDRQKVVLAAVALAADDRDVSFASQKYLAARVARTDRTVRTSLSALGRAGLITRYRRHRINGSRTTDLLVLGLPRDEPLSLEDYSGIVGEREPTDVVSPGSGLPEDSRPSGKQASGGSGKQASGPYPYLDPSPTSSREGGSGGEPDQTSLDVPEKRVNAFLTWYARQLHYGGFSGPSGGAPTRSAARWLLARNSGDDLREMFAFALGRTFWASKVLTLPKWKKHCDALRAEWLASREQASRRNGRDERPDRPAPRADYESEKVRITE